MDNFDPQNGWGFLSNWITVSLLASKYCLELIPLSVARNYIHSIDFFSFRNFVLGYVTGNACFISWMMRQMSWIFRHLSLITELLHWKEINATSWSPSHVVRLRHMPSLASPKKIKAGLSEDKVSRIVLHYAELNTCCVLAPICSTYNGSYMHSIKLNTWGHTEHKPRAVI